MSARQLLDQLLQSGQGLLSDAGSRVQNATGGKGSSFLTGLGGGALGAGALGLLLGSKKARKIGGKVAMYGGMAALGALAYRAYGDWQRKQGAGATATPPQTLDRLPAPQAEQHSSAVLTAMIGAAKADGHIGPEERGLLETELARLFRRPRPQLARSRTGASAGSGGRRPGRRHARDGRRDVPGQPAGGRRRKLHGACLPGRARAPAEAAA